MSSVRYCKPLFIQAGTFIKDLKLPQSSASRSNEQNVRGDDEVAMIKEEFTLVTGMDLALTDDHTRPEFEPVYVSLVYG